MKLRRLSLALAASWLLLSASESTAIGGNPFAGSTTTASGYHTWDSDLIDIEKVGQTGASVYVAVLDTGLVPNWSDDFPSSRVATRLGKGFYQGLNFAVVGDCQLAAAVGPLRETTYIGSRGSTHGTHVTSTILGYNYQSNFDAAQGFPLPPIQVRGIAPDVTIIPVKVLADYPLPSMPGCSGAATLAVFGTDTMVAAGIDYVTSLKMGPLSASPVVINMSLGASQPSPLINSAIDSAIAAGVIVVAAAGNDGPAGMDYPGAYPPVISAGAMGWTGEWVDDGASGNPPANGFRYRMWWLQNVKGNGAGVTGSIEPPLFTGSGDVVDEVPTSDVYVTDFSGRQLAGQDLDVVAPGSWVRGPFPGTHGYNHLPWYSKGRGDLFGGSTNFFWVGGTSMATPHVASTAALMLQKNPSLSQATVEGTLEATALKLNAGSRQVWNPFLATPGFETISWGIDAVGSGVLQVDAALAAVPSP